MDAETWFSADEAVAVGLADEAMPMKPTKGEQAEEPAAVGAVMNRTWDLSMYRYAGREHAPQPAVAVAGQRITAELLNGITNTAPAPEPVSTPPEPLVVDFSALSTNEVFLDMVRDLVRQEITSAASPAAEDNGAQPDDSPAAPEGPGEEQQITDEDAEAPPVEQHVPEEIPPDDGDTVTETYDQADDTNPFVGLLHAPTSPGADDVFAHLKEGGW
jgi:hypothetical protein